MSSQLPSFILRCTALMQLNLHAYTSIPYDSAATHAATDLVPALTPPTPQQQGGPKYTTVSFLASVVMGSYQCMREALCILESPDSDACRGIMALAQRDTVEVSGQGVPSVSFPYALWRFGHLTPYDCRWHTVWWSIVSYSARKRPPYSTPF